MLNLDAAIDNALHVSSFRDRHALRADHAKLQPQVASANGDRLFGDGGYRAGISKHVDHIDLEGYVS